MGFAFLNSARCFSSRRSAWTWSRSRVCLRVFFLLSCPRMAGMVVYWGLSRGLSAAVGCCRWLEDSAMGRWLVRLFRDLQTLKKFRGMRSRPWQQDQTAGLRGG